MKRLLLTQSHYALLDDEDHERAAKHSWHVHQSRGKLYARRSYKVRGEAKTYKQYLHHFVVGSAEETIDHRDGNPLNNQKSNLRKAGLSQNQGNSRVRKDNTSGYKGVVASATPNKWSVKCAGRAVGVFPSKEEAAVAYDCAAIKTFEDYSYTNFDPWRYVTGCDLIVSFERGLI